MIQAQATFNQVGLGDLFHVYVRSVYWEPGEFWCLLHDSSVTGQRSLKRTDVFSEARQKFSALQGYVTKKKI